MKNETCDLLEPRAVKITDKGGIATSEGAGSSSSKYDVININFLTDIKSNLLDKLDTVYETKENLFGDKLSLSEFKKDVAEVVEQSMELLGNFKAKGLPKITTQIEQDLNKIVKNTTTPLDKNTLTNLQEPLAYGDNGFLTLALDSNQTDVFHAMERSGVTSVNKKPTSVIPGNAIVKGLTDVTISLEDIGAMEDSKPLTPSVALNNKFVDLVSVMPKATTDHPGTVKFASEDEIKNKLKTDSAVSPKQIKEIVDKTKFVADVSGPSNVTYAYVGGVTSGKGEWKQYTSAGKIKDATKSVCGLVYLSEPSNFKGVSKGTIPIAATYDDTITYIQNTLKGGFKFPKYSQFFYAAIDPDENQKLSGNHTIWVRVYNDPSEVPEATQQYYGAAFLASEKNIEEGTPGAHVLTAKYLSTFLNNNYGSLVQQIQDGSNYMLNIKPSPLGTSAIDRTFKKLDDVLKTANKYSLYDTNSTDKKSTTKLVTPAAFKALFDEKYPHINADIKIPTDKDTTGVWARSKEGFVKIAGTTGPASTSKYGVVKIANKSKTKAQLETDASNTNTTKQIVPKDDINLLEKAITSQFKNLPKDNESYLFTRTNSSGVSTLGFSKLKTSGVSSFKTVFLDENDQETETFYRSAVHVVSVESELKNTKAPKFNYPINIAQVIYTTQ